MCLRDGEEADVGAHHVDITVSEVDELDDAVDHRIAERDQRVDAAERYAIDELLQDLMQDFHRIAPFLPFLTLNKEKSPPLEER